MENPNICNNHLCSAAAGAPVNFTYVNSVQMSQGQRPSQVTKSHQKWNFVALTTRAVCVTGMQFREINLIVLVHTCSPEMPSLFSLQIYFCVHGVIWGRHPLRQSRLGALGACWREFRNVSFDALLPMEIQAVRLWNNDLIGMIFAMSH